MENKIINNQQNALKLWDSHAHLMPPWFTFKNIEGVVQNAKESQLEGIINVCSNPKHELYQFVLELSKQHDMIHTNIGLQPTEASKDSLNLLKSKIIKNLDQICAVGEVGLDYYWIKKPKLHLAQKEIFIEIIQFTNEIKLPLVVHSRKAEQDCLSILEKYANVPVLLHGFEGNLETLDYAAELNYLISIPTSLSIRKKYRRNALRMPMNLIMLETDSPFQLPFNYPKNSNKPLNEPKNILLACKKVAELRDMNLEDVSNQIRQNTRKFFNI